MPLTAASYLKPELEPPADESSLLIYLDDNGRLQVGTWGLQVTVANMQRFKFGSVVGFTFTGTSDGWGSGDVKFNPTSMLNETFEDGVTGWRLIPHWGVWPGTKPGSYGVTANENFISIAPYHTLKNVKAGFGDPCQLVGYTQESIAEWEELPPPTYRLPTNRENNAFVGYSGVAANNVDIGTSYRSITNSNPKVATLTKCPVSPSPLFPMIGHRNSDGGTTSSNWNEDFHWWSSTPYDVTTAGYDTIVGIGGNFTALRPSEFGEVEAGLAVRCVRVNP